MFIKLEIIFSIRQQQECTTFCISGAHVLIDVPKLQIAAKLSFHRFVFTDKIPVDRRFGT